MSNAVLEQKINTNKCVKLNVTYYLNKDTLVLLLLKEAQ